MAEATSSPTFIVFVIVALSLLFFVLVFWAVLREKRRADEIRQRLLMRGFTPLVGQDAALLARLARLRSRPGQTGLRLTHAFQRPLANGTLYLFDLSETGGGDASRASSKMAAVISPALYLPRFSIVPRIKGDGVVGDFLAQTALKVLDWAASQDGLVKLPLSRMPVFDERNTIYCADEVETDNFLTEDRLAQLLSQGRAYVIQCGGDAFTLERAITGQPTPLLLTEEEIELALADAQRLLAWLQ